MIKITPEYYMIKTTPEYYMIKTTPVYHIIKTNPVFKMYNQDELNVCCMFSTKSILFNALEIHAFYQIPLQWIENPCIAYCVEPLFQLGFNVKVNLKIRQIVF